MIFIKSLVLLAKFRSTAQFSTTIIKYSKIETIDMVYTVYESPESVTSEPPLIVMHGLFGSKSNWNTLCKLFHRKTVPRRKIIAVDSRNHGDSPHSVNHSYAYIAEDIKVLIARIRSQKAALLGHSMGGRAMMYLALTTPELVEKLIVVDVSPITNNASFSGLSAIITALQQITLPKNVAMSSARKLVDTQLSSTVDDQDARSFILQNLVKKPDGSYAWRLNLPALLVNYNDNIAKFPDVATLQYTGPVLFIAGGLSNFIEETHYPQILKLFPKAEFKVINGAGHWLHSEKPGEFFKICIDFLNKKA